MIHTETKFAYRHKPTGKWVALETFINNWDVYMHLVDEFVPEDMAYKAINVIEEDLMRSSMNGIEYYRQNSLEFELVEIEVQYKIKQEEYSEIRIWENSTGWPN
jgi:hypothetical protein